MDNNIELNDTEEIQTESNKKKNNKKKVVVVVLLIIVMIIILLLRGCSESNIQEGALVEGQNGMLPGLTTEEAEAIMQKKADESMFSFDINGTPTFDNGKAKGNVLIANPPYNLFKMKVIITLDETNEVVFKSDMLEPNQYIENAKLSKNLDKGEYEATAVFEGYDLKEEKYQGEFQAGLVIKVLN